MKSSLISKIEKAKRYAEEKERVKFSDFKVDFQGEHDGYVVSYEQNKWNCSCLFFSLNGTCSHTMAMQRILSGMLPVSDVSEANCF